MRHSNLALVLIRLRIDDEPHLVLIRDRKWGDWTLVGGHVEPYEKSDWARAAARECDEELAPLKFGQDFVLLPLLKEPLRWGPIPSKSADGELTTYRAQFFALRFLRAPTECLTQLPADDFRIVSESAYGVERAAHDKVARAAKALGGLSRVALAWDSALVSPPIRKADLQAMPVG